MKNTVTRMFLSIGLVIAGVAQAENAPSSPATPPVTPPTVVPPATPPAQISLPPQAVAELSFKQGLKAEMEYVAQLFSKYYAPKEWKEKHIQWNLDAEKKKSLAQIDNAKTMYDVRRALVDFVKSTQDYHVSVRFNTTESATLPVFVRTVDDVTLVVDVDYDALSPMFSELTPGSRILAVDGVPISDVLAQLQKELGRNVAKTDQALSDIAFSFRRASNGLKVPQGPVMITFQTLSGTVKDAQLVWYYSPPAVPDWNPTFAKPSAEAQVPKINFVKPMMISDEAEQYHGEQPYYMGARKPYLSDFGARLWSTSAENTFDAYMYKNQDGKIIGVVRIPSYVPPMGDEQAAIDFAGIVAHFQTHTDSMIIDQLNNPGGSLFLVYTLASMLVDRPVYVPKNRVALDEQTKNLCVTVMRVKDLITSDSIAQMFWGPSIGGYPITKQFHQMTVNYCTEVMNELKAQKTISKPIHLYGFDRVNPFPGPRYSKKIVVLVNELDFSGGDWFPTILQDYNRSLPKDKQRIQILGTRTAGAGGYISQIPITGSFGISRLIFTGSLAERADLNPIENLGVTPDVEIPVTARDYLSGFAFYKGKVAQTLKALMN